MPTSTSTTTSSGKSVAPSRSWAGRRAGVPSRIARGASRRRRVPYLVVGLLLVVVCAAGAVITVLQVGNREPMLSLARPVNVGDVLTPQDLRQIPLPADSDADLIPASNAATVLGRPVAYSLPAGTLLSRPALGRAQVPVAGEAIVAVAAKPGQFPPEVTAGTTVSVITVPHSQNSASSNQTPASGGPWSAVVTSVGSPSSDQTTVVSLRLPVESARQLAEVPPGQLSLVTVPAGGQ